MKFPCELLGEKYLATIRRVLSFKLREKGYSQQQIGRFLGISQPVVSGYLRHGLNKPKNVIEEVAYEVADNIVEYILSDKLQLAMKIVCTRCKALRNQGPICTLHKEVIHGLNNHEVCTACLETSFNTQDGEQRYLFLNRFTKEIKTLLNRTEFPYLIPEIGLQIAVAPENATHMEDVISFPGRIIKVKNRAVMVSNPEYGASISVPKILLWARKTISKRIFGVIACKNIAFLRRWVESKGKIAYKTTEIDRRREEVLSKISKLEKISDLRLIQDEGGMGLEPISYLFFEDLIEIHELLDNYGSV